MTDTKPRQGQTELVVMRGLPGSGKTTRARRWIAERPDVRARVNRDDIRAMFGCLPVGTPRQETMVTAAQHGAAGALLRAGIDVVADDTNLTDSVMHRWQQLAHQCGARLTVWDLRDVDLQVCIDRDRARGAAGGRLVGADIITDKWRRYIAPALAEGAAHRG